VPLEPTIVPPARGAPPAPGYLPPVTPPAAPPPSGLLARLRARRAGLRRGVSAAAGAALGRAVVLDVAPGAAIRLGQGCAIGERCKLQAREGTIAIGAGAVLGARCTLTAHAGIEVGDNAVLGDEAVAIDFDHRYADVEQPVRLQGLVAEPVRIGAGARIGARAALQRGVAVGENAEVAALAVVTRDVPRDTRVGGVPAQPVSPSAGRGTRGGSRSRRGR
jgi:acetyltransferase-like isoleucine patch superfamily enzyme